MEEIRWARSATRHRISKERIRFVIAHCGRAFRRVRRPGEREPRVLFVGDDAEGRALEVIAVELEAGVLFVIHAMPLRERYRAEYEEARRWRR